MLNLRNILQHDLDLNANVTYAVLTTVKTKPLSNQHKTFIFLLLLLLFLAWI